MMTTANLDQTMMALADGTRRAILSRLSKGEARVTELAEPFDMSLNAVSKHILILERAGLVRRRIQGREHILTASPKPLDQAAEWIEHYRRFWEQSLDRLDEYLTKLKKEQTNKEKKNGRSKK
jgi:DNA-binding transcriptional ArsR family regulator